MEQKGISLRRINDILRRVGLVLVIGVGRDQDMHVKDGTTRLWIEWLSEHGRRCVAKAPVTLREGIHCGDVVVGKFARLWWYSRDGGQTWQAVHSFMDLPPDVKRVWEEERGNND